MNDNNWLDKCLSPTARERVPPPFRPKHCSNPYISRAWNVIPALAGRTDLMMEAQWIGKMIAFGTYAPPPVRSGKASSSDI